MVFKKTELKTLIFALDCAIRDQEAFVDVHISYGKPMKGHKTTIKKTEDEITRFKKLKNKLRKI